MEFDYFYGRGTELFAFYQIPKILITDEKFAGITMDAKLLYSLLLDRSSLSAKNDFSLRRILLMVLVYHRGFPAPVRIPSA